MVSGELSATRTGVREKLLLPVGRQDYQQLVRFIGARVLTTLTIVSSFPVGAKPVGGASFGEGSGPVVSFTCTGRELEHGECAMSTIDTNCHHGRDSGVVCQGDVLMKADIRITENHR